MFGPQPAPDGGIRQRHVHLDVDHRRGNLDHVAVGLSALCLVHCLAFPVLIVLIPALAGVLPQQWWIHPLILALALPLASVALYRGWRRSRDVRPVALGLVGIGFLVAGVVAAEGSGAETVLTVTGGLVLAAAHLLNWRIGQDGHVHPARRRPPR